MRNQKCSVCGGTLNVMSRCHCPIPNKRASARTVTTVVRTEIQRIIDEHIRMPGFPQIIVTRGFCYQFLASFGWGRAKGFASADYAAFGNPSVDEPLTPEVERDYYLNLPQIHKMYERE